MAADPLSTATRTTKRNLLAVASAVILVKVFDVSVERIPVGGVALTFDRGAVMFALVAALVYFLAAFGMYYWIDIKDNKETEYEKAVKEWYRKAMHLYREKVERKVGQRTKAFMPEKFHVSFGVESFSGVLEQVETFAIKIDEEFAKELFNGG